MCHRSDRNLGAREWDYDITKILAAEFDKKYGDDPMENKRCILRLLEAVEKGRKMLSSVGDAIISVDYLLNEEDLVRTLKREEFEQIIEPSVKRLSELIRETLEGAGLTPDKVNSVELLSDATRTPIIMETIKAGFQKDTLERTLNSLEAVARGAAL